MVANGDDVEFFCTCRVQLSVGLYLAFASNLQNLKGTPEEMEDEGNFLRRSVNDITSLLDINFGSLGRPTRGGRGRGARGGPTSRPERVKPILERVCFQLKRCIWVFGKTYWKEKL